MANPRFQEADSYAPRPGVGYRLLPFRFMRWPADEVLLVNDAGEQLFLADQEFGDLVHHRLGRDRPSYLDLKARHFLIDSTSTVPIDLLAAKVRTKKSFLEGFTKLHMFVVTLRCDHSCPYCQVSRVNTDHSHYDMSRETALRAIDLMFGSPARGLKVEFQGGEPLLNFDLIRFIVDSIEQRNAAEGRQIEFVIATNLALLTDTILEFLRNHSILVSTSLDGPELLHNANRPRPGNDSHRLTVENIGRVREALGHDRVSAVMTTTERSLNAPREIVDEYVRLGFRSIFLRSISPYGFAVRTGMAARYAMNDFLAFYREALDHILELNRQGVTFKEIYAEILLRKILTPFPTGYVDLQSPAGAGLSAVAYNYDGDVYASDEARMLAEMGDRGFLLGNVHRHSYPEIFGGATLRTIARASILESLPGCSDCAFLPFCGGDPVFHHRTQGDLIGHRPTSAFCAKNMAILRHLFLLLRGGDPFVQGVLTGWGAGVSPPAQEQFK